MNEGNSCAALLTCAVKSCFSKEILMSLTTSSSPAPNEVSLGEFPGLLKAMEGNSATTLITHCAIIFFFIISTSKLFYPFLIIFDICLAAADAESRLNDFKQYMPFGGLLKMALSDVKTTVVKCRIQFYWVFVNFYLPIGS